jgi:hypothetical protein
MHAAMWSKHAEDLLGAALERGQAAEDGAAAYWPRCATKASSGRGRPRAATRARRPSNRASITGTRAASRSGPTSPTGASSMAARGTGAGRAGRAGATPQHSFSSTTPRRRADLSRSRCG